jgi:hypothetical protein
MRALSVSIQELGAAIEEEAREFWPEQVVSAACMSSGNWRRFMPEVSDRRFV